MVLLTEILNPRAGVGLSPDMVNLAQRRIDALFSDPKYKSYFRITPKVCNFLDYFRFRYTPEEIKPLLSLYFVWLKVADDEIDNGHPDKGKRLINRISNPEIEINEESLNDTPFFVTELLKSQFDPRNYSQFVNLFNRLYDSTIREAESSSMDVFIPNRKIVGKLVAECAYQIILPRLSKGKEGFLEFFQEIGALGNLVDTVCDIKKDINSRILKFEPSLSDIVMLYANTAKEGVKLFARHPCMYKIFASSTIHAFKDHPYS